MAINGLKKAFHGLETELRFEKEDEVLVIPSTGEIGRSIFGKRYSLSVLTDPHFVVKTGEISKFSITYEIQRRTGGINILNIGCGGCADIPYLQKLLENSLSKDAKKVNIVNADLSDKVIETVRSGEHPYYIYGDLDLDKIKISKLGSRFHEHFDYYAAVSYLGFWLSKFFIFQGEEMSESVHNGWMGGDDNRVRKKYEMKKDIREKLKIEKADIRDLPYQSESYDIVIAQGLFRYLSDKDKLRARSEIIRVLKPYGFCLPELGVYQRRDEGLVRVNGRIWPAMNNLIDVSKNGIEKKLGGILPITYSLNERFPTPFSLEDLENMKNLYDQWNYYFINQDSDFEGVVLEEGLNRRKRPARNIVFHDSRVIKQIASFLKF